MLVEQNVFTEIFLHKLNYTFPFCFTTEFSLVIVLLDLFAAGAETVSSTLNYAVLYLLNFPEIQRKLHTEIDKVTGGNRMPELSDRLKYRKSCTYLLFLKVLF